MEILINCALIVVGFVLLIKGADYLVDGASSIARKFRIPEITIGLTIVAMGTSAPELVVNLVSGINGHTDVVLGNVIGSNLFNILLILGISGAIYPLAVKDDTIWKEIPFSLVITLILFVFVNDHFFTHHHQDGLSMGEGIILLTLFGFFMYYIYSSVKNQDSYLEQEDKKAYKMGIATFMILGGGAALSFGGILVVNNAVALAHHFNVSEKMIGLTIISAGTSLPELATSAVAAYKRKPDLAVGNILGSNIFNILLVLGLTVVISPMDYDTAFNLDLGLLLLATVALFVFMFTFKSKRLDRIEGIIFIVVFVAYMVYLFIRK